MSPQSKWCCVAQSVSITFTMMPRSPHPVFRRTTRPSIVGTLGDDRFVDGGSLERAAVARDGHGGRRREHRAVGAAGRIPLGRERGQDRRAVGSGGGRSQVARLIGWEARRECVSNSRLGSGAVRVGGRRPSRCCGPEASGAFLGGWVRVGSRDFWTGAGRFVRFVAAMSDGEDLCLRREEQARRHASFGGSSSGAWACLADPLKRLREVLTWL